MSGPDFTVIVPAYNVAGLILPCLRSIVAQTEPGWQAIVVDDGSTDPPRPRSAPSTTRAFR